MKGGDEFFQNVIKISHDVLAHKCVKKNINGMSRAVTYCIMEGNDA